MGTSRLGWRTSNELDVNAIRDALISTMTKSQLGIKKNAFF